MFINYFLITGKMYELREIFIFFYISNQMFDFILIEYLSKDINVTIDILIFKFYNSQKKIKISLIKIFN